MEKKEVVECGCEEKKLTENTPLGMAWTIKMCRKHAEEEIEYAQKEMPKENLE